MNRTRIASFTLLCLALAVIPASAQDQVLYENGPINGTVNSWTINFGYVVSDSFTIASNSGFGIITRFDLGVWEYPGDTALTVDWSITADENGGITFGSGTSQVIDTFISTNQFGYEIHQLTSTEPDVRLENGTYWLNIQNATTEFGDPLYWDENSGVGCQSNGCPSQASESAVGTIASEAFDVQGGTCDVDCTLTPEPSSILLFGSGLFGLAGVLRRKLF